MPERGRHPSGRNPGAPPERSGIEPFPENEDQHEAGSDGRGPVIAAVIIGAILLIIVALHLFTGGISPHGT
jgi:hypothetical protein